MIIIDLSDTISCMIFILRDDLPGAYSTLQCSSLRHLSRDCLCTYLNSKVLVL